MQRPWKCPVCEGCGAVAGPDGGTVSTATCHACTGSGVVWGPPEPTDPPLRSTDCATTRYLPHEDFPNLIPPLRWHPPTST